LARRSRLDLRRGLDVGGKPEDGLLVASHEVLKALDAMPPRIDTPILVPDIETFRHREWTPAARGGYIDGA
jgi:hypothetical protein